MLLSQTNSTQSLLQMEYLNKAAFEIFARQPVNREMISYLADASKKTLARDPAVALVASLKSQHPENACEISPRTYDVQLVNESLPTLETFIAKLVVSANVQVPTLMSTLVYLRRLKSNLQGKVSGRRCAPYRIFLASLILAGKYLNDISPNNKYWASHTVIKTDLYSIGFNRDEVNLMEKQLLFLLEWNLHITEQDLYRELEPFLRPLRTSIQGLYIDKMPTYATKPRLHIHGLPYRLPFPKSIVPLSRAHRVSSQLQAV